MATDADRKRGLYAKYSVHRRFDKEGKHKACTFYVLDLKHDPYSWPALRAYAIACDKKFPKLAADIRELLRKHAGPCATEQKTKYFSLTDAAISKLPEHDRVLYEAHNALTAILNWHQSGKTKGAEAYFLAMHQCAIAEQCLEMYWENEVQV